MSFLRRTADRIAGFVVRHASAGSKEWAEAMAGELAYIENDWQALLWALSGMRVLLRIQQKPLQNVEDLAEAARKHASKRRWAMNDTLGRHVKYFPQLLFAFQSLIQIAMRRNVVGNCLIVAGALLFARSIYLVNREPNVPDRDDLPAMIRFYRDDLAAQWTSYRTLLTFASFILLGVGYELSVSWPKAIGLLYLAALPLGTWQYLRNRKRLAEIEALMADSPFDSQR